MLEMIKDGKIPNPLIKKANELFVGGAGASNVNDENLLKDTFEVIDVLCEEMFLEPTYKQIKEAGISLTDDQMMFLLRYSQEGVKALETFR